MSLPTTLEGVLQDAHYERVFHNILVAAFSVLAAEFLHTIVDEIRFMWHARLSIAKVLYFANRYFPIFNVAFSVYMFMFSRHTSLGTCRNEFIGIGIIGFLEFQVANAVLCVRAYAVWKTSKGVFIILLISFIISFASQAYLVGLYISGSQAIAFGNSVGCNILLGNNKMWVNMIVQVCSDALSFALLLAKTVISYRTNSSRATLLTVMVKDGLGYFASVAGLSLANLIVLRFAAPIIRDSFVLLQAAMQNVLCVRLLLHLHIVNKVSSSPMSEVYSMVVEMKDLSAGTTEFSNSSTIYASECASN